MRSSSSDVLPSDTAFEIYLATVSAKDLSPFEWELFRHHRFEELKAS